MTTTIWLSQEYTVYRVSYRTDIQDETNHAGVGNMHSGGVRITRADILVHAAGF